MTEPRIGRFLVASLHQAIAELLPDRLEFYENWLSVTRAARGHDRAGATARRAELPARRRGGLRAGGCARRRLRGAVDGQRPAGPRAPRPAHAAAAPEDARGAADRARSRQRDVSRLAGDRAHAQGDPSRSICAARCSARCAKHRCSRSAGSTPRRSRASCSSSPYPAKRRWTRAVPPGAARSVRCR